MKRSFSKNNQIASDGGAYYYQPKEGEVIVSSRAMKTHQGQNLLRN